MTDRFRLSYWAAALAAVLVAVAIGGAAYQAGVTHGLALQPPSGAAPLAFPPYYYYRPWGFGLFGPFFFVLLWLLLFRLLFWGGRRRYWYRRGYDEAVGRDRFDEWHRKAHERMNEAQGPPPTSA